MRFFSKGGPWTNVEDEILKAAIMKYGKNQWARVSSLLNRKTARQCKARWYEWLDPSIKKTEWTREEEEKLIHLAKIMPTQWRTIAPIVGRTPNQCMTHYEKLLDQAQTKEGDDESEENDPRKLKPGEIDPNPETKPPRPDPIDMDEDEKEMLSEARARLANTQGKKAKRKARERQLEEAKRLAALQKRRELKAAGIFLKGSFTKLKPWEVNYNKEIPYHHTAAPGLYNTSEEKLVNRDNTFINMSLKQLEGKSRYEKEQDARKRDLEKVKNKEKSNLPKVIDEVNKLNNPNFAKYRPNLNLSKPQVSDRELEEIGKIGSSFQENMDVDASEHGNATSHLLTDYANATPSNAFVTPSMRTPLRTPRKVDTVMLEAQNLIALSKQETPLKGGESAQLNETFNDFKGVTPSRQSLVTPNPLATPSSTPMLAGLSTPMLSTKGDGQSVQATPTPTPLRDELRINSENNSSFNDTPSIEKRKQKRLQSQIRNGFSSLPLPKQDLTLKTSLPDIDIEDDSNYNEQDATDREKKERALLMAKKKLIQKKQSQPVQRDLPRPQKINKKYKMNSNGLKDEILNIKQLIQNEIISMVEYDAIVNPYEEGNKKKTKGKKKKPLYQLFSVDIMNKANQEILSEMNSDKDSQKKIQEYCQKWSEYADKIIATKKGCKLESECTKKEIQEYYNEYLKVLKEIQETNQQKIEKSENKSNLLTKGYIKRYESLSEKCSELMNQIGKCFVDKNSYEALEEIEARSIKKRLQELSENLKDVNETNEKLQMEYLTLSESVKNATNKVQQLYLK